MAVERRELALGKMELLGGAKQEGEKECVLSGGSWYQAEKNGDGVGYRFEKGALAKFGYLTSDFLLDGVEGCEFMVELSEGEKGATFQMYFGFLNQCGARAVVDLEAVQQKKWMYRRRGAFIKPLCGGQRVNLELVDRMRFTVLRKGLQGVRFAMTEWRAVKEEPGAMTNPVLPKGPLLDQLGQSTIREWAGKTRSVEEVVTRLREQAHSAINQKWPSVFSKYGGYAQGPRLEGKGFFRTHHDGKRWWLVDPEGYLFWSAGMDCVQPRVESRIEGLEKALAWQPPLEGSYVGAYGQAFKPRPESLSFSVANMIRAFGEKEWFEQWGRVALAQLKSFGINTIGNWSEWSIARSKGGSGFPYVRPLSLTCKTTPMAYRDFPDVFHVNFGQDATEYAQQLWETKDDPALVGYFLMNEPTWGFAAETVAAGMLFTAAPGMECRKALAEFLRQRYGTNERLSEAWGVNTTYVSIAFNAWTAGLNETAKKDLEAFSTVMVERLFKGLTDACKQVDPNHMNLGARYYTVPPDWALEGMKGFDVFSVNAYAKKIPVAKYEYIAEKVGRPVMVGEWHFGALDAGLPASGIGHVRSQAERGKAYRVYLEDAASCKACVGVHWFTMYDQSALGRFDGENYNIGFVDVCNRPYEDLVWAARAAHERMYRVALGEEKAYNEEVEYLPMLFY